jgi:uncharacterized protein DUF5946
VALGLRNRGFVHQHVVDGWTAQHADDRSKPIAVAFALLGLYLHIEKGYTGREVQRVHMLLGQPDKKDRGRKEWPGFPAPNHRGDTTVVDVMAAAESERIAAIEIWCESVWNAWRESQQGVRDWAAREVAISAPPPLSIERKSPR